MNDREVQELDAIDCFTLDGNLGRTAKWLRVLGFDAVCPAGAVEDCDYHITTRRSARIPGVIVVEGGNALDQVRQVIEQSGITPDSRRFLSRCLVCNEPVRSVEKERVKERVPVGILSTVSRFRECPSCGRVYWQGSHWERMLGALEAAGVSLHYHSDRRTDVGQEAAP